MVIAVITIWVLAGFTAGFARTRNRSRVTAPESQTTIIDTTWTGRILS